MLTLPKPTLAPAQVLTDCIKGCSDSGLSVRLTTIKGTLASTADQYDALARSQSLHIFPRRESIGQVSRSELEALYSEQMSATRGAGRAYYDAIRNASPNAKCPLCGVGTVTVLDHHLPKSKYPDLSVCPYNLVPCCDFCNNAKRARYPKEAGEQTIHPYYDDFTQQQWIFARLDTVGPLSLIYYVHPPHNWPEVAKQRAARHFSVVKLGTVFSSNANDDLIILRHHLVQLHNKKGTAEVLSYLDEEKIRYSRRLNSWQYVMYQTLAADSWFAAGGYLKIPG